MVKLIEEFGVKQGSSLLCCKKLPKICLCSALRDVTVSKTHGTIIPQYQLHGTVFIVVFKKKLKLGKNAAYYYPVFMKLFFTYIALFPV